MNAEKRAQLYARLQAANPEPRTELHYGSPFELLIAVMLSAQATDKSVNLATARFFPTHPTPQSLLDMGLEAFTQHIRSIGLYKTKAKHVMQTCRLLIERHGGEVPANRQALQALPGVGRKTANVILNTAFGQPVIAVDTHIFRVANRTGLAPGKTVQAVETRLMRATPKPYRLHAHHWLILHGRYVCVARKPRCPQCGIADLCEFGAKVKS